MLSDPMPDRVNPMTDYCYKKLNLLVPKSLEKIPSGETKWQVFEFI